MTKRLTATFFVVRDAAEGQHESGEMKEPVSPLQTTTLPAFKTSAGTAPAAETGLVAVVPSQAEGQDKSDSQDASRTTAETQPVPSAQKLADSTPSRAPAVLILEDAIELAEVIQATLEELKMVTAHETHGSKALSRFDEMSPDVILLDINLPDMTGWKFLETIKENHRNHMPAVVVITAYGDPANRLVAKLQGVHDYLIKPFTPKDVERVVTTALQSTRMA